MARKNLSMSEREDYLNEITLSWKQTLLEIKDRMEHWVAIYYSSQNTIKMKNEIDQYWRIVLGIHRSGNYGSNSPMVIVREGKFVTQHTEEL